MKTILKIAAPVVILIAGAGAVALMVARRPAIEQAPREIPVPLVRVLGVQPTNHQFRVRVQGTVRPQVDLFLTAEAAGRVVAVAPQFEAGGFFAKDDVLVTVDPRDYEVAVIRAKAQLAEATVRVQREEAEAEVARKEWTALGGAGQPNALLLRGPQLAEARAMVSSAGAALQQAELDLERCRIRAPFAGRVWEKKADAGQYVRKGDQVARIYAVDHAEVRLPVALADVAYLELPLDGAGTPGEGPEVTLRARVGGETAEWRGRIVRTEGEIDARTRMVTAVARVADPYGRESSGRRAPLAVGLFVEGEISGRPAGNVLIVPRAAMRGDDRLMVVDAESRLRLRPVTPVRMEGDRVILRGGVGPGERVCVSPLDAPTEGMQVRVLEGGE